MARGVNKVILVGNLGKDPEVRYMGNGAAVANITIATSESWKDKQTGDAQERTEWHNVVFFNRLAEIVGEFLKKGSQVYIEGALRTRKYTDKNGIERFATEVVASEMQMLGSRQGGAYNPDFNKNSGEPYQDSNKNQATPKDAYHEKYDNADMSTHSDRQKPTNGYQNQAPAASANGFDDSYDDDDIPF